MLRLANLLPHLNFLKSLLLLIRIQLINLEAAILGNRSIVVSGVTVSYFLLVDLYDSVKSWFGNIEGYIGFQVEQDFI